MHGAMPIMQPSAKSASSSTMVADLPPSSRKRRFIVAAPFSMIRLPTTVEPVNEIRSTFGDSVSSSPTKWSDAVTTFTTPAGMSVLLGDQPAQAGRVERRVRRRLQHDGVAGCQRLAELLDRDLEREVPRHDRADHADGFPPHLPGGVHAGERDHRVAERRLPRVFVDQLGRVAQRVGQRRVELRSVGDRPRAPDLEDELLAQLLLLGLDRFLQLQQALLAEGVIRSTSPSRRTRAAPRRWRGACRLSTRRRPRR